ncbi:hypothetical protein IEE94_08995 [Yimella sp. cx-573]|nr:hypothetical protein [Yimella sp. cx-573]
MKTKLAINWLLGPWAWIAVAAFQIVNFWSRGRPWVADAMLTIETAAIAFPVLGALVCGAAALDAARLGLSLGYHPVSTAARGSRAYLAASLWTAVPAAIVNTLVILGALVYGRPGHPTASWPNLAVGMLVQGIALFWFAAVGSALGRHLQPFVAGVAGGVVGYLTILAVSEVPGQSNPLDFGGALLPRVGLQYNLTNLTIQAVVLLATGIAAILLSNRRAPSRSWLWQIRTWLPLALIASLFLGVGRVDATPRVRPNTTPPTVCTGTAPRICTYPEQREQAPDINEWVSRLADDARSAGYGALVAPQYWSTSAGFTPKPPVQGLELPDQPVVYGAWAQAMLTPTHCPQLQSMRPPTEKYFTDMKNLINTWIAVGERKPAPLSPAQASQVRDGLVRCQIKVA